MPAELVPGSFFTCPVWLAKEVADLDPFERCVMMNICMRSNNETQAAFPSIGRIAKDTGCSERQVIYSIKKLVSKKYLIKTQRFDEGKGQRSNIYQINWLAIEGGGAGGAPGGVQDMHRGGAGGAPITRLSRTRHLSKESKSSQSKNPRVLDDTFDPDYKKEWDKMLDERS